MAAATEGARFGDSSLSLREEGSKLGISQQKIGVLTYTLAPKRASLFVVIYLSGTQY